ncbi:hypothetical protein [Scytonema sp. NUACC26]|uniref:hypothetical protein n=1 Tax=Scytonema sp. NUACC26 TaxID=3140176 RepID=UPI0038B2ECDC
MARAKNQMRSRATSKLYLSRSHCGQVPQLWLVLHQPLLQVLVVLCGSIVWACTSICQVYY